MERLSDRLIEEIKNGKILPEDIPNEVALRVLAINSKRHGLSCTQIARKFKLNNRQAAHRLTRKR